MKKLRKRITPLIAIILTAVIVIALHSYGTKERGYPAIGGEALIPAVVAVIAVIAFDERKKAKKRPKPMHDHAKRRTSKSSDRKEHLYDIQG